MRALCLAGLCLVACKEKAAVVGPAPPPRPDAGPVSAAPPATPEPDAAPASGDRILAETPGGTVPLERKDAPPFPLPDGAIVGTPEDVDVSTRPDDGWSYLAVTWKGHSGWVRALNLFTMPEPGDERCSPDGQFCVHEIEVGMGDCLHCAAFVVGPGLARVRLGGDGKDAEIDCRSTHVWRADGRELAFGSWDLYLVGLPGLGVTTAEGLTAPLYAPDGRLLARRRIRPDVSVVARTPTGWKVVKRHREPKYSCPECDCMDEPLPDPITLNAKGQPK